MTHSELKTLLLALSREHYSELWQLLEDLETLLWKIKTLNDDMDMPTNE